jgi:hypothetical protein
MGHKYDFYGMPHASYIFVDSPRFGLVATMTGDITPTLGNGRGT